MAEAGDDPTAGFSELYEANYKKIFNYMLCGTGNVETAMDLTSDSFFKALRAWPRFEHRGVPPAAWLFKIASRELTMFYRRQGRLKRFAAPLEFNEAAAAVRGSINGDEVEAAKREVDSRDEFMDLSSIIRKLPGKYREVIYLRYFAGMRIEEISELTGRPVGTVKSQLHRALKRLRLELQPDEAFVHYETVESGPIAGDPLPGEEAD
ncbi:MAG: sigma-70 family RNA polymerase sigma factor [Actinobacteria bacterium]|nr:sigma-70 family RNA polymerase sigma factor [Actinomycetota bacterium]